MGDMTRDAIIEAGQGRMGNKSSALQERLVVDFQAWLTRQYQSWSWPFLKKRAVGISLAQGATSLTVGNGNGGITNKIIKLGNSPIIYYTSDRSVTGKAPIVQSEDVSLTFDETLANSTTFKGTPNRFKVRRNGEGIWDIIPLPFPDRALLLGIPYYEQPAALASSGVPIYPSDATMIQAVVYLANADQKKASHPDTQTSLQLLEAMISRDRANFGADEGENDVVQLDPSVFGKMTTGSWTGF